MSTESRAGAILTDMRLDGQPLEAIDMNCILISKGCTTSTRIYQHSDALTRNETDAVSHVSSIIGSECQVFSYHRIHHSYVKLDVDDEDLWEIRTFYDEFMNAVQPFLNSDPVFMRSPFDYNIMKNSFELMRPFGDDLINQVLMAFRKFWEKQDFMNAAKIGPKAYSPFSHISFFSLEQRRIDSILNWRYVTSTHKVAHQRMNDMRRSGPPYSIDLDDSILRLVSYGGFEHFTERTMKAWLYGEKYHGNKTLLKEWKELSARYGSEYLTNVCCAYLRDRIIAYLLLFMHVESHFCQGLSSNVLRMVPIPPGITDPALAPPRPKNGIKITDAIRAGWFR